MRHFTPDYLERAVLSDGTAVVLRLVAPEDKQQLREGFERWSPESRYARFLTPKTTLTDDELQYLTEIDQETHFALGAVRESDGRGLGVARFIALPDEPGVAEAAIAVADDAQGKGLGKLLLLRLCAAAAERGIAWFRCDVLASNTAMVRLLDQIAPDRTTRVSQGVVTIDLALPAVAPHAAEHPAPRSPLYRLFRAAAENVVEWTETVRRLWRR